MEEDRKLKVTYSYPNDKDYEYSARMERIDFDKERELDLQSGEGFIIADPNTTIKKDIKDPNGLFSEKFGQKLGDTDPFIDRYRCSCGHLRSRIHNGIECPVCHQLCKYVDDDFKMFGWIKLVDEYPIIHPDLYIQIDSLLGKSKYDRKSKNREKGSKLRNILDYDVPLDVNGNEIMDNTDKPDEPFYGLGFLYFIDHFDEIIEYYYKKNPKKKAIYDDIMADREKVFIHSIPVFTSHLRPMDISNGSMYYEKCTAIYTIMVKLAHKVNKNKTKMDRTPKVKSQEMFNLQTEFMNLYDEIIAILSGKRGQLRMLVGGELRSPCEVCVYSAQIDTMKEDTRNFSL